ncbi:uncharacterized protein V1513DRAFT_443387 [Lipomyces chichibuensis]|uniref:uncharacterized protein n=1 Tax=Lipomyces chichibuensis TaxID=1546026 RepID=UPI0033435B2F
MTYDDTSREPVMKQEKEELVEDEYNSLSGTGSSISSPSTHSGPESANGTLVTNVDNQTTESDTKKQHTITTTTVTTTTTTIQKTTRIKKPVGGHAPSLFLDLPAKTEEAKKTFEELTECTYSNKSLGDSGQDEIMTCDCKENWDGNANLACDELSDCINRMTSMECVDGECNCGDGCRNQRFQRREYASLDVIQTDMKGYGIRAMANIAQGTFIYEYIGEVIDEMRFRRRMQQYDEDGIKHFYFMMLQKGEFVDATQKGCLARFCNHSCNPNCYVDKWAVKDKLRMGIFAKRDIIAGEEITFDYNVDRYGAQAQPCYCGEPNCIGFIGGKTQTEAAPKLSQVFVDALGISDDEEWATATSKRKRRIQANDDEEYVSTLPTRPVTEEGVSKIMSGLLQCKEKWLASKLLKRIHSNDDLGVQRRVMRMHGYQILGSILREWKAEDDIVILVLEILSKWPRMTRNKISSSKIESTVSAFANECESERINDLAKALVSEWQNLEMAYRIPRRERPIKTDKDKEKKDVSITNSPEPDTKNSKTEPLLPMGPPTGPRQPTKATFRPPQRGSFYRTLERTNMTGNGVKPLPWGWSSAEDPNGRTYYYNRQENRTQWEFPEGDFLPPPPPPPPPVASTPAPEKLDLQKIIDEANKKLAERAKEDESKSEQSESKKESSNGRKHRSRDEKNNDEKKQSNGDITLDMKLTKTFAKYVPNVVARYEKEVGRDDVKKYSKEITKILVEKELRPGHVVKNASELSDDKKKKVKLFITTYMDKLIARRKEKAEAKKSEVSKHSN